MQQEYRDNSENQLLYPKSLRRLSMQELEELKDLTWSKEDLKALGEPDMDSLPLQQRFLEYVIGTYGWRNWIAHNNVKIPGSSIVHLYSPQGQMRVGGSDWPLAVDARGHFTDGTVQQAGGHQLGKGFTVPGVNKFCMLVRTSRGYPLIHPKIPNWGSSLSSITFDPKTFWQIDANSGGTCMVAFNDDWDFDNSGHITEILRITQGRDFVRMYENLIRVVEHTQE